MRRDTRLLVSCHGLCERQGGAARGVQHLEKDHCASPSPSRTRTVVFGCDGQRDGGVRQVFGAVAKAGTDISALIRLNLGVVGRTDATVVSAFYAHVAIRTAAPCAALRIDCLV